MKADGFISSAFFGKEKMLYGKNKKRCDGILKTNITDRRFFIESEKIFFVMISLVLAWLIPNKIKEGAILRTEKKEEQKIVDEIYAARKKMFGMGEQEMKERVLSKDMV